jgi:hypothetical protein
MGEEGYIKNGEGNEKRALALPKGWWVGKDINGGWERKLKRGGFGLFYREPYLLILACLRATRIFSRSSLLKSNKAHKVSNDFSTLSSVG